MRPVLVALIFLFPLFVSAQNCDCLTDLRFVKNHIETNHGGYNKKIKGKAEKEYNEFVQQLEQSIKVDTVKNHCIVYLKKYILYLQDHHSNITPGNSVSIKEDSSAAVEVFFNSPEYRNTEMINIDNNTLARLANSASGSIEGMYSTADGTYVVALIKNGNSLRDYAAVIADSKTKLWKKGQVKFELKQVNDSTMDVFMSYRNHSTGYEQATIKKGQLQLTGWTKNTQNNATGTVIDNDLIKFTILDDNTTLLSIRSFNAGSYSKLDSVYKKVIPEIKKHMNLIIDVRNNGGGSDASYGALLPLLYTDPIIGDVVELYNTPVNMKAYSDYDSMLIRSGNRPVFADRITQMKKSAGFSFIPMGTGEPGRSVYKVSPDNPKKIAILYNRNCASSCESFLFDARYSKKTILVGENSGGYTGYGNVMNIKTPCGNTLSWTTTVYRDQWKYEFVGIPPYHYVPDNEADWVEYCRKLIEK